MDADLWLRRKAVQDEAELDRLLESELEPTEVNEADPALRLYHQFYPDTTNI